ncbi:MAG: hypothetical protein R3C99_16005 [Pirellulaceae bacterium]
MAAYRLDVRRRGIGLRFDVGGTAARALVIGFVDRPDATRKLHGREVPVVEYSGGVERHLVGGLLVPTGRNWANRGKPFRNWCRS